MHVIGHIHGVIVAATLRAIVAATISDIPTISPTKDVPDPSDPALFKKSRSDIPMIP